MEKSIAQYHDDIARYDSLRTAAIRAKVWADVAWWASRISDARQTIRIIERRQQQIIEGKLK